jgi:hypothetical protein
MAMQETAAVADKQEDKEVKEEKQVQPVRGDETASPVLATSTEVSKEEKGLYDGGKHIAHDSMVTVRLSEPPQALHIDTNLSSISTTHARTDSRAVSEPGEGDETPSAEVIADESPRITMRNSRGETTSLSGEDKNPASRRGSGGSEDSQEEQVNWEELEKTEGQEPKDQWTDDVRLTSVTI